MTKLTPKETVHKFCHRCVCNRADDEVVDCGGHIVYATGKECPFYPYRNGEKRISVKVFREFCMECQGDSYKAIDECKNGEVPAPSLPPWEKPGNDRTH